MRIDHPAWYRCGTRVVMLKGRHKDGIVRERQVLRPTHSAEQFDRALDELSGMRADGERIYASAAPRDLAKAIRKFKEAQLAADYDDDPQAFYRALDGRWTSALMAPTSAATKLWLFDCDDAASYEATMAALAQHRDRVELSPELPYVYPSKSGWHVIVRPFDRTGLPVAVRDLIHDNPIMLWEY